MRASQEAPVFPQRLGYAKRMMGLEPTTFCMASRCSSQLSYIRALAQYSRRFQRRSFAGPLRGRRTGDSFTLENIEPD